MLADNFLATDSTVKGIEHLDGLDASPLVIIANHLSYADANLIDILLERAGGWRCGRIGQSLSHR